MILFKIFSKVSSRDDSAQINKTLTGVNTNEELLTDTFSIRANYRDPFSGKTDKSDVRIISTDENKSSKKANSPKQNPKLPINNVFPNVRYEGLIKNKQSNKQLILVRINGQSNIMKIGEIVNEVELTKVFRDSIEVKFQKEKKFILK